MSFMNGEELEDTLVYQDFVTDVLYNRGFPICAYSSKRYNIDKGESRAGVEIKNDKRFNETGNLYFETHEKRDVNNNWTLSGIKRDDNTTFYFIGDYKRAWLFSKKQLKVLCENYMKYGFKEVETPTSKGILIPIEYFETHNSIPIMTFDFEKEKMFEENYNHIPRID